MQIEEFDLRRLVFIKLNERLLLNPDLANFAQKLVEQVFRFADEVLEMMEAISDGLGSLLRERLLQSAGQQETMDVVDRMLCSSSSKLFGIGIPPDVFNS
jgi:hypothetical protein